MELDGRAFRRFVLFEVLRRRKRWRSPALFAAILSTFSAVCLLKGSSLLASVLLVIGLGLPAVWFGTFLAQVNAQARRLDFRRAAYTVTLDETGVMGPGVESPLPWGQTHAACRVRDDVYLYVTPSRAILIPAGLIDREELWRFLEQRMPGRCHVL